MEEVFEGYWFKVFEKRKNAKIYHLIFCREGVRGVPIYKDGIFVLKERSVVYEREFLKFPGGYIEKGETPENAMKREMAEEIGYIPEELHYIGIIETHPKYVSFPIHYFVCKKLKKIELEHNEEEEIKDIIFVRFEEISRIFEKILDPKDKLYHPSCVKDGK